MLEKADDELRDVLTRPVKLPSLGNTEISASDSDRFRARTLSLADDSAGGAADLVETWLMQTTALAKLNRALSRRMAKKQHDKKYIERCYTEFNARALRVEIEQEFALRSWWPGFDAIGH